MWKWQILLFCIYLFLPFIIHDLNQGTKWDIILNQESDSNMFSFWKLDMYVKESD